jgi:hypothetical protein
MFVIKSKLLILVIGIMTGCFIMQQFFKHIIIPNVYKFESVEPHFSNSQKQIIEKTLPQAINMLKAPEEYYLGDIRNGDTITLTFYHLSRLRSIFKRKDIRSNTFINIKFDKNYNLINK